METSLLSFFVNAGYFIAAITFIYALKRMSHPSTARRGIHYAGLAMLFAVVITLIHPDIKYDRQTLMQERIAEETAEKEPHFQEFKLLLDSFSAEEMTALDYETFNLLLEADQEKLDAKREAETLRSIYSQEKKKSPYGKNLFLILLALGIGSVIAYRSAKRVKMTDMPQMIAIYNGVGGGSAAIIGALALLQVDAYAPGYSSRVTLLAAIGGLIGAISFTGSIIAWAKLDGRMNKTIRFKNRNSINLFIFVLSLLVALFLAGTPTPSYGLILLFFILTLAFGVLIAIPIGGADMPVIISLFNALTGIAVAFEGIALDNGGLIIAGTVVGAAGTLLTQLMAKAMNRPLRNVLFSNFGDSNEEASEIEGSITESDATNAAMTMGFADRVIVVPGYGLAAAQAQHKVAELTKILEQRGVDVRFAIHPVAGRMPGHMNVLLAESGIPYDLIFDLEEINPEFKATDAVLVIGANDVVNPVARTDENSPIYGMPILNADEAKQVFVIKRGQGAGFSGVENHLFYHENTDMVYGDAQKVLNDMIAALKTL